MQSSSFTQIESQLCQSRLTHNYTVLHAYVSSSVVFDGCMCKFTSGPSSHLKSPSHPSTGPHVTGKGPTKDLQWKWC